MLLIRSMPGERSFLRPASGLRDNGDEVDDCDALTATMLEVLIFKLYRESLITPIDMIERSMGAYIDSKLWRLPCIVIA